MLLRVEPVERVLPAPAGMIPLDPDQQETPIRAPRASGDDPMTMRYLLGHDECSPRQRG